MSFFFCPNTLIHNTVCYIINLNNVPCSRSYYSQFPSSQEKNRKPNTLPKVCSFL